MIQDSLAAWLSRGVPPSTARTYRAAFAYFCRWCGGAPLLPCGDVELASYIRHLSQDRGLPLATIHVHVAAVRRAHLIAGHIDPSRGPITTLARVAARQAASSYRSKGREDCPPERLRRWLDAARSDASSVRAARDAALLTLGWWAGARGAELAALRVGDVAPRDDGLAVRLVGKGGRLRTVGIVACPDEALCAVNAWSQWRPHIPGDGPAFRRLYPSGVGRAGISAETVRAVVHKCAEACEDDGRIGAHSLRVGLTNAMLRAGTPLGDVMAHLGWRRASTVLTYYRGALLLGPGNPTRGLLG